MPPQPSAPTPTAAGTFPGVAPGTYYLMISTRYNNQALVWGQAGNSSRAQTP